MSLGVKTKTASMNFRWPCCRVGTSAPPCPWTSGSSIWPVRCWASLGFCCWIFRTKRAGLNKTRKTYGKSTCATNRGVEAWRIGSPFLKRKLWDVIFILLRSLLMGISTEGWRLGDAFSLNFAIFLSHQQETFTENWQLQYPWPPAQLGLFGVSSHTAWQHQLASWCHVGHHLRAPGPCCRFWVTLN